MISIRVDPTLQTDARDAAKIVGLKVSDLGRIGLAQVVASIKATGKITLARPRPTKRKQKGAKA